jgi:hypothetical protein
MTKQEADFIGSMNMCDEISNEAYKKIMCNCEVEEQQPCEDCVSRKELLSRIDAERRHLLDIGMDGAEHIIVHHARRIIEDMPSVKPQRPPAKWLDKKMTIKGAHGMAYGRYACSVCKKKFPNKSNYCPDCGAKMEGEEC